MNNAELIKAIRCYLNCQCCEHDLCDYILEDGYCNIDKILSDAADALEAAEKRIDGLQKLVDINTERCEALRKQLRESHENYEKQIAEQQKQIAQLYILLNNRINEVAELESQMPKQDRGVCMTACGTLYVPNYDD